MNWFDKHDWARWFNKLKWSFISFKPLAFMACLAMLVLSAAQSQAIYDKTIIDVLHLFKQGAIDKEGVELILINLQTSLFDKSREHLFGMFSNVIIAVVSLESAQVAANAYMKSQETKQTVIVKDKGRNISAFKSEFSGDV